MVVGYAMAVATGTASVGPMKIFRTIVLLGSFFFVLTQGTTVSSFTSIKNKKLIIALCLITPAFTIISKDIVSSLSRTMTFIIPLLYIWISINLLLYRYGQKEVLDLLSRMIMIIYAIPMLSYIVFDGDFSGQSIYGESDGQVFVSNHFGWSAALFLISNFHVSLNRSKKRLLTTTVLVLFIILAVYLLIVSGNRSSWLSTALSLIFILFYYKGVPFYQKFLIVISPIILFSYLISQKNDAVLFVIERTERKAKSGDEGRLERLDIIIKRVSASPSLYLTGVGMFNYDAFLKEGEGIDNYHNSYFELLFGVGIPLFILYMLFMLYEPIKQFIKRVSKYDLLLIPLIIIPFFESNLTSGQFLFFPWFSYVFALNAQKKFAYFGTRNWFHFIDPKQFETTHPGPEKGSYAA